MTIPEEIDPSFQSIFILIIDFYYVLNLSNLSIVQL